MKKLLNTLLLLTFTISVLAAEVTGKVIDAGTKQAIDFANVSVLKGTDPVPVKGTVTDEKGEFVLDLANGSYTLVVSFMGYSEQKREVTIAGKPVTVRFALKEASLCVTARMWRYGSTASRQD